jgi:hypothetical protein
MGVWDSGDHRNHYQPLLYHGRPDPDLEMQKTQKSTGFKY